MTLVPGAGTAGLQRQNASEGAVQPTCVICGHHADPADRAAFGAVRGNTERFMNQQFTLWKCPTCQSIRSLQPVDYAQMYSDYPLNRRRLDVFAKGTLSNLLRRLVKNGLAKTDAVLDYGCGNGLFIDFLKARGYSHVTGYDPFVTHFSSLDPEQRFDCGRGRNCR